MYFKDYIPDKLQEYPNVSQFINVLDSLQDHKQELISEALRVNNPSILLNKKWLLKKLEEFGVIGLPLEYPIPIIIQYLLNVDTVCRTRGSQIGIELYCSLLSLGEVIVDDSNFYSDSKVLLLDSPIQGYITSDNSENFYHVISDNSVIDPKVTLDITISSKYFNGNYTIEPIIKKYIEDTINNQLSFSPVKQVSFTYKSRDSFYFHKLLNPYFV